MVIIRLILMLLSWTSLLLGFSFGRVWFTHHDYFEPTYIDIQMGFLLLGFILWVVAIYSYKANSLEELNNNYPISRKVNLGATVNGRVMVLCIALLTFNTGFYYHTPETEDKFLKYYSVEHEGTTRALTVLSLPGYMCDAKVEGLVYIANELDNRGIGADALLDTPDDRLEIMMEIKNDYLQQYQQNKPRFVAFIVLLFLVSILDLLVSRRQEYQKQLYNLTEE